MKKMLLIPALGFLFAENLFAFNEFFLDNQNSNKVSNVKNIENNVENSFYNNKKNDELSEDIVNLMKEYNVKEVNGFIEDKNKEKPKIKYIYVPKKIYKIKTVYKIKKIKEKYFIPKYVNNSIYFDFNSFKLNQFEKKHLDDIINVIKKRKINTIVIVGYADKVGTKKYNLELSKKRAEAVAKYIKKRLPNIKIIVKYKGNEYTIFNNKNKIDRRVDIFFTN